MMKTPFSALIFPVLAGMVLVSCEPQPSGSRSPAGTSSPMARAGAPGWSVAPLPQRWSMRGFTEDKDLSGIASWDGVNCLVCSDELRFIESGVINAASGTISASGAIDLLPPEKGGKELDAEGVAVARSEGCYYVTGSHGVGKKSGEFQASRCHVMRIPVDPATGQVRRDGIQSANLLTWAQSDPVIGRAVGQSLQANGFNIEGLTWKGGRLWFGVRAPNYGGDTFVIETSGASLFSGRPQATLHRLQVGPGNGIREIAALNDGFLVVTGDASSDVGKDDVFTFFHWKPGAAPVVVGNVPSPSGKAEGLYILGEKDREIDVLVIFDGASGGGPKAYRITKP